ncbi:MAG: DUF6439 family protein [Synechococcus sp.]|jgi:hypothetical protein|uniref:DUF6439 family protein n=1 Tax=Synechococcus sp. BMK-MC-1 TaxID=1442551 RepID=UPI0016450D1D|nr:DUF6439 family protein [Synechococcus sp. BMK-MC-1]
MRCSFRLERVRVDISVTVNLWPDGVVEQAKALHQSLTIGDREWHKLKSNADRRGAELLAAALTQLLQDGEKRDVEAMTEQALGWIRRELKDPGCPHR